jgi:hypothetical protein
VFSATAIIRVTNSIIITLVGHDESRIETGAIRIKIQSRNLKRGKLTRQHNTKIRVTRIVSVL